MHMRLNRTENLFIKSTSIHFLHLLINLKQILSFSSFKVKKKKKKKKKNSKWMRRYRRQGNEEETKNLRGQNPLKHEGEGKSHKEKVSNYHRQSSFIVWGYTN